MAAIMKTIRRASRLALPGLCIAVMASCSNDEAIKEHSDSDILSFGISMSDEWNTASRFNAEGTAKCDTMLFDGTDFGLLSTSAPMTVPSAFDTTVSRAAEISQTNFYDSFGVYGYVYQGPDWLMRNNVKPYLSDERAYAKGNDIWATDRTYYWPDASCRMHFYAFAPHDMATLTINGFTPELSYEVPDDATSQKDLMYAVADVEGDYRKNLNLQFGHMLTGVKVHAAQSLGATIKRIALKNVRYRGSYNFDNPSWTVSDDKKDFSLECDVPTNPEISTSAPVADGEYTFMMIPQDFYYDNLGLEITLEEENGEVKKITKNISTFWEKGTMVDMLIWRSFTGMIHYIINNREQKTLMVMNVKPGLERTLSTKITDFPDYIVEWSLSPEVDEFVKSTIWNINNKDLYVYTRGAMLLFLPETPDGAAVTGMPKNTLKTGREYVYTFAAPQSPSCEGYIFKGWASQSNGTTTIYEPDTDIVVSVENPDNSGYLILRAIWEKE